MYSLTQRSNKLLTSFLTAPTTTLKIKREVLHEMLSICTSRTPLEHINGNVYVQIDEVSMGSCLGPTFAEYYMCEKKTL